MALKVELKPGEKIIVGTVAIRNGDNRARFFIEGQAPILREKDILTAETTDTPAKHIYFAVQLMYIEGSIARHHETYFQFVQDFLQAAPSAVGIIAEINNRILSGEFYKALKTAKDLIAYEQQLMQGFTGATQNVGGNEQPASGVRENSTSDTSRS